MLQDDQVQAGSLLEPETHNATDYPITTVLLDKIGWRDGVEDLMKQRKPVTMSQLDLAPYGEVACFYTGPFKAAADAFPLDTPELRAKAMQAFRDGWAQVVKEGKVTPGFGGRIADGVDAARRAINAVMPAGRQVRSYFGRVPRNTMSDPTEICFYRALYRGWQLTLGRFAVGDQVADIISDGVLDAVGKPSGKTYGHCFNAFERGPGILANENYPKKPKPWENYFKIPEVQTKADNGLLFSGCYYFLPA